jgi:hypothetical protein
MCCREAHGDTFESGVELTAGAPKPWVAMHFTTVQRVVPQARQVKKAKRVGEAVQ